HVSASSAIYTLSLHDALPIYQPPGFAPVYNPADSFLHFPGGLVGEGQGGYVPSGNAQLFNQVSDFSGDHAGFATASAGQHQQGAVCVANRFSLSWVELVHNIGAKKGTMRRMLAFTYSTPAYLYVPRRSISYA